MTDITKTVDPVKLMHELNKRPELWGNILQSMSEISADETKDDPTGHASFEVLLAVALGEHTERYDEHGNETEWLDVYSDPNA